MKKVYISPEMQIDLLSVQDIITTSTANTLVNGGANGTSPSESFGSMFGS